MGSPLHFTPQGQTPTNTARFRCPMNSQESQSLDSPISLNSYRAYLVAEEDRPFEFGELNLEKGRRYEPIDIREPKLERLFCL